MTVIAITVDARSTSKLMLQLAPMDSITRLSAPRGILRPDFVWEPEGPVYVYPNSHSSGAVKAPATEPITFVASYTSSGDANLKAVRYEWDLGDGTRALGPEVTHTYSAVNASLRVSLCVTDNLGVRRCIGRQLLLFVDTVEAFAMPGDTLVVADS